MADFANFTYDAETATFKANSTVAFEMSVAEHTAVVIGEGLEVTFDWAGNLQKISCVMMQEISNGETLRMNFAFGFSAYGTTVVENPAK